MAAVDLAPGPVEEYDGLVDSDALAAIRSAARSLRGLRVVHINATPSGGGVAEILRSLVPLMKSLSLEASWWVLEPDDAFFAFTKKLHNGLQGKPTSLSEDDVKRYWAHNQRTAVQVEAELGHADIIVLHDAQVLPMAAFLNGGVQMLWHCHVDMTTPNEQVRDLIAPMTHRYARCAVSMPEYVMAGMPTDRVSVFPPAIDPFSAKNLPLSPQTARQRLSQLGIDVSRPLVTQVSRFDPWKDPWGVIDAYRLAKRHVGALQLALVGALIAQDDPEGALALESVRSYAGDDPDIHLFADPQVADDTTVNAFQTASTAIIQKSTREGFGLTVTEAMWKGTPVIGGDCGGIRLQIDDGVTGYLVSSAAQCADRIVHIIAHPEQAKRIGAAARESVCQRFLMPRLLLDYLRLFQEMVEGRGF